jgi:hypothetical protein
MPRWSIGRISGQYQPEDFTETQASDFSDVGNHGGVSLLMFKGYKPREIAVSFVVDGVGGTDGASSPERAWAHIQEIQRPAKGGWPTPIEVIIPGWGDSEHLPKLAYIVNSSINRTHITSTLDSGIQAVRATISVTLKEAPNWDRKAITTIFDKARKRAADAAAKEAKAE